MSGRLSRSSKRVPDHPSINRTGDEGRARIGGRQKYRSYVTVLEACLLKDPNQKKMNIGSLVERTRLPFRSATDLMTLLAGTRIASLVGDRGSFPT
jgi:hypothetical protein